MMRNGWLLVLKSARFSIAAASAMLTVACMSGCASSWRYTTSMQPSSRPPADLQLKLNITTVDSEIETDGPTPVDPAVLEKLRSAQTAFLMGTARRMHPKLFSHDRAALPVRVKISRKSWPDPYNWTWFLCITSIGVLPAIEVDEFKYSVYVELLDDKDRVLDMHQLSFDRHDFRWYVAWTPLILLDIPGRSDRPKVHSMGKHDPKEAAAEFTRECHVEAIMQAAAKAGWKKLERAYADRRRRIDGEAVVVGPKDPPEPDPKDLVQSGYDNKRLHALVIGIDKYKHWPDLKCAANDAKAVAEVLKKNYDFANVNLLTNEKATREGILKALDGYNKLTDKDSLLVYYAGHGWMDGKTKSGYWVPSDARVDRKFDYIANSQIAEDAFKKYKVKHLLVIADSCFSGTLLRGQKVVRDDKFSIPAGFRKPSRWILTSGGLKPVPDGQVDHSPFAARLLQYLKFTERKTFGVLDLHVYLRENLDTDPIAGPLQTQQHMPGGEFIFRRTSVGASK